MIILYRWSQDGIRLEWPHKAAFREEGILLDVQGTGGVERVLFFYRFRHGFFGGIFCLGPVFFKSFTRFVVLYFKMAACY